MDVLASAFTINPGGFPDSEIFLADDFLCTQSGPVTRIDLWSSYREDMRQMANPYFSLAIYEDIPASQSPTGYSIPGALLWDAYVPATMETLYASGLDEGFYDPGTDRIWGRDTQLWQYTFEFDLSNAFVQDAGNVYWLGVHHTFDLNGDGTVDSNDVTELVYHLAGRIRLEDFHRPLERRCSLVGGQLLRRFAAHHSPDDRLAGVAVSRRTPAAVPRASICRSPCTHLVPYRNGHSHRNGMPSPTPTMAGTNPLNLVVRSWWRTTGTVIRPIR